MFGEEKEKMEKVKRLKCKECGKEYSYHNKWVDKHAKKFKHYKFKRINDEFLRDV